ncbi:cytochrome P450 [Roridomyces roridus]|uniref:Cytochrome P450 n=1 Tax=Roridomyces roridus TaxID=1738132 RepID=A0AAD7BSA1_9AGAR|nr:cytochrome P450 [Roridomyces roridus]
MPGEMSMQQLALSVSALILGVYIIQRRLTSNARPPPGPRGLPLLGNILQIPGTHLATNFRKLCEDYGGFVSLNLAGFPVILIGNMHLAKEILEKRSASFSARPLVPYSLHFDPAQIYWTAVSGQTHFIARKLTAGVMAGVRAGDTQSLQRFEALIGMMHLLKGRDWFHEMERTSTSTALTAIFGLHCPTGEETELKEIIPWIRDAVSIASPGASIINALPFLDRIPGPMPWRTRAAAFRKKEDAMYDKFVTEAIEGKGAGMNTWAAAFASKDKPEGDQRRLLNIFSLASVDTTASSLHSFVLASILYPDWISRARAQLDAIVGPDRLPTFKDRTSLPWVEAVVRETLRWRPAVRFALPHQSTADEMVEYKGKEYFIRKGSIVFPVTWAIEHDIDRFEDTDTFNPERFLDTDGQLRPGYETSAFGFGRRVCPGSPFAERTLWINIAMILWAFNIRKSDQPFEYGAGDEAFIGDITNGPLEFPAVFEARSARHAEVVWREWEECEKDLGVLMPAPQRGGL